MRWGDIMADLSIIEKDRIGKGMNLSNIFSSLSGKVEVNEGTDRVNQSLSVIFETSNGEVAMLPIVGSGVAEMLFEPADGILKDKLELYIRSAIELNEPRINVQDIVIDVVDNDVYVTINYVLTGTNMKGVFDYNVTTQNRGDNY